MSALCLDMLTTKAGVLISTAREKQAQGQAPCPFYIDEMSAVASDLIELNQFVLAGRVDCALVDWCGLLLDA